MQAITNLDTLRGIIDALREDIDDSLSWSALFDWNEENNPDAWPRPGAPEKAMVRAYYLTEACALIAPTREGASRCRDVELHSEYAEPGYSTPACGVIALGNWNDCDRYDETTRQRVKTDPTPEMLGDLLEALGAELEWEDEWSSCSDCGKLVRTQPDCHHWTPSYHLGDGELLCMGCCKMEQEQESEQEDEE